MKYLKLAIPAFLLALSTNISATVIDFDSVGTSFTINSYTEDNFNLTKNNEGLATVASGYSSLWEDNGTGSLLSWNNHGDTSGFILTDNSGSLFSLTSFDFDNGYTSNLSPVSSITLTGLLGVGGMITETFRNTVDGWMTVALSSEWQNLKSVDFIANGLNNRTMWDNIDVNGVSTVPVPAAAWLFGSALLGFFGFSRRKANA